MSLQEEREARRRIQMWERESRQNSGALFPTDWPESIWRLLARDFPELRVWVAHTPHAPEAIVRALSADPDGRVRERIASRRRLPPDLFAILASDSSEAVRQAVAGNAKTPLALVRELQADAAYSVRYVATAALQRRTAARGHA